MFFTYSVNICTVLYNFSYPNMFRKFILYLATKELTSKIFAPLVWLQNIYCTVGRSFILMHTLKYNTLEYSDHMGSIETVAVFISTLKNAKNT